MPSRQVPTIKQQKLRLGLVGGGKLSSHFNFYFQSLGYDTSTWTRSQGLSLQSQLQHCDFIFICITENALPYMIEQLLTQLDKPLFHTSASFYHKNAQSFHPLMSFTEKLYSEEFYKTIPIMTEKEGPYTHLIKNLFPNPFYEIDWQNKTYYHALCSMGANLSTLLWQIVFQKAESIGLKPEVFFPILMRTAQNLQTDWKNALTGPLERKDFSTLEKQIASLDPDLQKIYRSFLEYKLKEQPQEEPLYEGPRF